MEKRTLYAVVVMAVLGIAAFATVRAPDKGQRSGPPPRPVPVMKASELTKVEITSQAGVQTTLEKKGEEWRVTAPSDWPADAQAVKTLTEAIEKLSFGDIVTENPAKHGELGVGDKNVLHLKLSVGAQSHELLIGQTVGGFTLVRLAGKNEVWQSSGFAPYVANKPSKDWREHAVIPLTAADVDKLTVEVPGGSKLTVEKDAGASWKLTEATGDAPKPDQVLDPSQPTTVAQALAALRANDFADDKSAKDAGLESPQLVLTVSSKGKTQTLELGAQSGDDVYVRKGGGPTIYVVKKYLLDRAMARPIDYRDKTLLSYKADQIAKVRVQQGKDETLLTWKDDKWTSTGPELDQARAKALVGGLDNLQGAGFVTDKAAKTELENPRATVLVEPKDGPRRLLKIGALAQDKGEYFVQVEGGKDVLRAKKFAIDRLLKKPSELQAGTKPNALPPPPGNQLPPH